MKKAIKKMNEKGAALITVLVAMLIIAIMILEFQYAAIVERQLAYNDLNQLQAYYLAKAGARVGLLRVDLYARAQKESGNLAKNFGGVNIKPFLEMIWQLPVPAFPPPKNALNKLLKADKDAAEKVLSETQITDGQYSHVITNESAKINLNYLQVPAGTTQRPDFRPPVNSLFEHIGVMLVTLLENFLRDSEDPYQEFGNLRPDELVYDIMDWVSPGDVRLAGGTKDSFYDQQTPPYKAKRHRFYTLDELKMVRGIDDHLFEKLKPYITVYSYDGKVNINLASSTVIKALYKDLSDDDITKMNEEKARRGGAWTTEQEFADYITKTLGRSGFATQYPNANDYPFTVSSQSFVVESLGVIRKSKSEVSRAIRVGVALYRAGAAGGENLPQAECAKKGRNYFIDPNDNLCKQVPRTQSECFALGSSNWTEANFTCVIPRLSGPMTLTFDPNDASAKAITAAAPNSIKVLYWTES